MRSPRPMDAERVMPVSIVTSALRVKSNSAAIDPWDVFFLLIPKFAPRGTTSLTKTNSLPLKRDYFNRKCIFQPLILRGHVSCREGKLEKNIFLCAEFWRRLSIFCGWVDINIFSNKDVINILNLAQSGLCRWIIGSPLDLRFGTHVPHNIEGWALTFVGG